MLRENFAKSWLDAKMLRKGFQLGVEEEGETQSQVQPGLVHVYHLNGLCKAASQLGGQLV